MKTKKQPSKRKTLNAVRPPRSLAAAACSSVVGMDTIEKFIAALEASAESERKRTPRDWGHDHGYARGKSAAFTIAVKRLRKLTEF